VAERLIKLTVEYDGSDFSGWQGPALTRGGVPGRSVQSELARAVEAVTGEMVDVAGAGRTDAGVHAGGQVACFSTASRIPADRFAPALTSKLPPDIAVLRSEEAPAGFHPRTSARLKLYRYVILNRHVRLAIERATATHVSTPLDVERMRRAARHLVGEHDFTSFAAREATIARNPVRTIERLEITAEGERIVFDVEGRSFLMHMVRTIVGSLIDVGRGRREPDWIADVLAARDRTVAGPTAPPQGLTLMWVKYG
jgi:tRNA pseudouridine38-40 synthase